MTQRIEHQPRQLPRFADEQAAADFWDDHSPLGYPEEFREADAEVARPLVKRGPTIELDHDTIEQLRAAGPHPAGE